jgi:hypothetical protein
VWLDMRVEDPQTELRDTVTNRAELAGYAVDWTTSTSVCTAWRADLS